MSIGGQGGLYWHDREEPERPSRSESTVDVAFRIDCTHLPADHAYLLFEAVAAHVPWLADEEKAGIHAIYGAASGNGWVRPGGSEIVHLSRRVRMVLRIPRHRLESCVALCGMVLEVADTRVGLGEASVRELGPSATLFARRIVSSRAEREEVFLDRVDRDLSALNVPAPKRLPGKMSSIATPAGMVHTRSLLLADLEAADSLRLQESGLGTARELGCGLFVPHKSISAVNRPADE